MNLAMLAGRERGSLHYRKVAGNIADVTTVKTLIRDIEPFEVLAVYRDKGAIEKHFGGVKPLLDFRTSRVLSEQTLSVKLLVVFAALVLVAWLRRRMRETGLDEDYTLEGLIDEVEAIERYTREGHRPRVCEIIRKQRPISDKLDYGLLVTS